MYIFTRVNKIKAVFEVSRVNVKVERGSTFTFMRDVLYTASNLITQVKKIKAMYGRSSIYVKLNLAQPLRLCVAFQTLLLFYLGM